MIIFISIVLSLDAVYSGSVYLSYGYNSFSRINYQKQKKKRVPSLKLYVWFDENLTI